ncbi:nuclear transport factor 2 family protein [Novosphingobium sp. BL-8A]|uniref:nuclear transport factor 2 family protein n=1 Tax=Novosphingobium sp. BL-8A TaxID=3127639 RepID=UPI0037574781
MSLYTAEEGANLRHVTAMFEQVLNALDADAVDRFISADYIQHNQGVGEGTEPLKALLRHIRAETPEAVHDVKRLFADGDHVIVHYHVRRWPGDLGWAVVDIFRLADGMIVEHWDVVQPLPETSPNPIGPF